MHIVKPLRTLVHPLATWPGGRSGVCPATTYLESLKVKGRRVMAMALDQFAALVTDGALTAAIDLNWSLIGYEHTLQARNTWAAQFKPAGARVRLNGVKGAVRAAWKLGLIDTDRYMRAIALPPIKGKSLRKGRALSGPELDRLFLDCLRDPTLTGTRDAALFALLRTGMRVGELVGLDLDDYTAATSSELAVIAVRKAKGDKERWSYLPADIDRFVAGWLVARGNDPGPLLTTVQYGQVAIRRLSESSVYTRCVARAKSTGLAPFSPHDHRRTTATELHAAGVPLVDIRDVLGHESITTTQLYLHNDREEAKRRAMARLKPPPT